MGRGGRFVLASLTIAVVAVGFVRARPRTSVPLEKLRILQVELDVRSERSVGVLMAPAAYDNGTDSAAPGKCVPPAANATATFNGKLLQRLTGVYAGGDLQYDRDCLLELVFPGGAIPPGARASGRASLEIVEGRTRVALEIPDGLTARSLAFVSPPDGVLHPGESVTLRWQPGTDDITKGAIELRPRGSRDIKEGIVIVNKDLSIHGDRIVFTVPAALPSNLGREVEIRYLGTAFVAPRSGPCPVDRCSIHVMFDVAPLGAQLVRS
ncbi:MAG TPA: hypothetical protein VGP64_13515 [Polyangia bacterium]|jgi:hypothetical protein